MRKRLDTRKFVIVLVFTTIIFFFGALLGFVTSSEKLSDVRDLQDSLRSDTLDLETLYAVLENNPCEFVNTTPLSDQLYDIAKRLDFMESQLGKDNDDVLQLKKYYSILQLRQWMFEERVQETCSENKSIILYFYNNEPGECSSCEEQGFILSYIREKHPETSIYSFDVRTESEAVQALVRRYVDTTPTIVIDEKIIEGFQTRDAIETILAQHATEQQNRTEH